jgi:predicted dehydrogenase
VPIRISREKIYQKELDFLISCSYGPGRYDPLYEEQGVDYPRAYVRWTEGRNLQEVLRLIAGRRLQVSPLVGARIRVDEAPDAYERLRGPNAPIAVMLEYAVPADAVVREARTVAVTTKALRRKSGDVVVGVIGAGSFFRGVHLPALQRHGGFSLKYLASRTGLAVHDLARSAGVPFATTAPEDMLADPEVDLVIVTTRHDSHAHWTCRALEAGKHVFVEKPLGLSVAECEAVVEAARRAGRLVAVGFNRRFAPLARTLRERFSRIQEPRTVIYRVNAGSLPPEHWLRDPLQGGGRLLGEGVHFFDFVRWLIDAPVSQIDAQCTVRAEGIDPDNSSVLIAFADGSHAAVHYISQGSALLGKERVECFGGTTSFVLDDFRTLTAVGATTDTTERRTIQKGHEELLAHVHDALTGGSALDVTAEDGLWATWCAERAIAALAGLERQ